MNKLTVTKEVAEAIERMKRNKIPVGLALKFHATFGLTGRFAPMQTLEIEDLAEALIVGYEVEKSQEDKIREYFEGTMRLYGEEYGEMDGISVRAGVRDTLDILGIKIEGVND